MVHVPNTEEVFCEFQAQPNLSFSCDRDPIKENLSNETELNLLRTCFDKLADDHKNLKQKPRQLRKILRKKLRILMLKMVLFRILEKQFLTSMRKLTTLKKLITVLLFARKGWMIKN